MITAGWRRFAALCLTGAILGGGAAAAHDCTEVQIDLLDLRAEVVLASLQGPDFSLIWRNSVTLTPVQADYTVQIGRGIVQRAERFSAHGPGMAYASTDASTDASTGDSTDNSARWRDVGGQIVLDLDRAIDRLILRSAPEHENRLFNATTLIDLTQWPARPLEIRARGCAAPASPLP